VLRKIIVMSLVVFGLSCVPTAAYSQTSPACQQNQAALWNEVAQLQEAIQILQQKIRIFQVQRTFAVARNVRDRIAEIQSQIDDLRTQIDELRKVIFEKMRQLMSGDTGCRPFNDIPEAPKGGRSILVPERGPPPQIVPPAAPKKAAPSPREGFALVPRTDPFSMLG
jgi:hypothetical protein